MILRIFNFRFVSRSGSRLNFNNNLHCFVSRRFKAKLSEKPIEYTKSKAYQYKALENFRQEKNLASTLPSYNSFVIKASFAIFFIYFGYLREPNDLDDLLNRDLFEIVPDLEIPMMELDIQRLEKQGMDVKDLRRKLEELKRLDAEKKNQEEKQSLAIKS